MIALAALIHTNFHFVTVSFARETPARLEVPLIMRQIPDLSEVYLTVYIKVVQ